MNGAQAVPIHQQMPNFITVRLPRWGTVESGGQDALIQHQHAADIGALAGAALGNSVSDFHEI
jgi:outer membrane lipoprotein SlyB